MWFVDLLVKQPSFRLDNGKKHRLIRKDVEIAPTSSMRPAWGLKPQKWGRCINRGRLAKSGNRAVESDKAHLADCPECRSN